MIMNLHHVTEYANLLCLYTFNLKAYIFLYYLTLILFQDISPDKTHKPHTPANTTYAQEKFEIKSKDKILPHDTTTSTTHPQISGKAIEVQKSRQKFR